MRPAHVEAFGMVGLCAFQNTLGGATARSSRPLRSSAADIGNGHLPALYYIELDSRQEGQPYRGVVWQCGSTHFPTLYINGNLPGRQGDFVVMFPQLLPCTRVPENAAGVT